MVTVRSWSIGTSIARPAPDAAAAPPLAGSPTSCTPTPTLDLWRAPVRAAGSTP
jgi:hypothetical protein